VARDKDYSVRAVKQDEMNWGNSSMGFNGMLSQIQERDSMLQQARDQLDQRVATADAELSAEVTERTASGAFLAAERGAF